MTDSKAKTNSLSQTFHMQGSFFFSFSNKQNSFLLPPTESDQVSKVFVSSCYLFLSSLPLFLRVNLKPEKSFMDH